MRRLDVSLAAGLVCLCAAGLGCNGKLTPQARELLLSSYLAYGRSDDATTIRNTTQFLALNPRFQRADEAYYLRGLARYRKKDRAGAKADLAAALKRTKNPDLRAKALLTLGDLAYDEGDMALAQEMYGQSLAHLKRDATPADHANYRLGAVLQRQGRWSEADVHFNRLLELFPRTELTRRAARRVHCTAWTVQAGAYGDKKQADRSAARLTRRGRPAAVAAMLEAGRPIFVVQVGRHSRYEEAVRSLAAVRPHARDAFVFPAR